MKKLSYKIFFVFWLISFLANSMLTKIYTFSVTNDLTGEAVRQATNTPLWNLVSLSLITLLWIPLLTAAYRRVDQEKKGIRRSLVFLIIIHIIGAILTIGELFYMLIT